MDRGPFLEAGLDSNKESLDQPVRPWDQDFNGVCGAMEDEGEEAQGSRGYNKPIRPSDKEVEEHERTHLPYRDWCPHCVRGRGRGEQHRSGSGDQPHEVNKVSLDYFYMHEKPVNGSRPAVVTGEGLPAIIIKDKESRAVFAFPVPVKGECEYAVRRGYQDIHRILG